jgi:hypothetical protein
MDGAGTGLAFMGLFYEEVEQMQIPRRLAPTISSLALVAGTVFGVNAATQVNAQAASAPQSAITTCGCGGCHHRCHHRHRHHHHHCWHHCGGCSWGGCGGGWSSWSSSWSSWNVNINDDDDDWDDDDD